MNYRDDNVKQLWRFYVVFLGFLNWVQSSSATSIEERIIREIVLRGVIRREVLRDLAKGHECAFRLVLSVLRDSRLIYYREQCKKCYIISMPSVFFAKEVLGDGWQKWLKNKAPGMSKKEFDELRLWLEAADSKSGELYAKRLRRIKMWVKSRLLITMYMATLFDVIKDVLPEECFSPYTFFGLKPNTQGHKVLYDCFLVPVHEYTPLLLRLLAGTLYAYAEGREFCRYLAEFQYFAPRLKKLICGGDEESGSGCSEIFEKLYGETVNRLVTLMSALCDLREEMMTMESILNEYVEEWKNEGFSDKSQTLYNYKSIVSSFLYRTFADFYVWTHYIMKELESYSQ